MKTFLVGMGIAGTVGLAQMLVEFDPNAITNWQGWALGLVGAFIRPVAVFVVSSLPRFAERS